MRNSCGLGRNKFVTRINRVSQFPEMRDMNGDAPYERDVQKLLGQLKAGNWLKVCQYGLNPAFVYSPLNNAIAHMVQNETAQRAIDRLHLVYVEATWNFDVYRLAEQLPLVA